jgi:hypothetical protein
MIWIIYVVRESFDKLKQVDDETIVDLYEILGSQMFDARHLVHELQQEAVQSAILVSTTLD